MTFQISVYLLIILSTGTLLFLMIKYWQEKPFGRQFVTDHLSVDLAITVFTCVAFLATANIFRELWGPFNETLTRFILMAQQMLNLSVLAYLLSMQIAQFCNVFFTSR